MTERSGEPRRRAIYSTEALSTGGGRDGHLRTIDGALDADLRTPIQLGGPGGGLNPEQLFAAGYAGCFHSALLGAARAARVKIMGTSVGARVDLVQFGADIALAVHLEVVIPHLDSEQSVALVEVAHANCPYSQATRGNIEVTMSISDD